MSSRRLLVLLCATMLANTFTVGAFPALLPEMAATARLADWQLGTVAGAFGLARMLADVPVGLFITHHLRRALVLAPAFLAAGVLLIAAAGSFGVLVLGRALMGAGHTLGMLGGLTAILRHRAGPRLASSLNAYEFWAMLGILGGVTLLGTLPGWLSWNAAFLVTCTPLLIGVLLLPLVLAGLPSGEAGAARPLFARSERAPASAGGGPGAVPGGAPGLAVLAFAAGGAVALSYSMVEQFLLPLRGSREFGLDRSGIARTLMIGQVVDILALLPVGALADRRGAARVLGGILLVFAAALALIGFGTLPMLLAGCVLFGLSMAGWMLPLGILRSVTEPGQIAWRTALYRVSVDGGIFLGPFLSGLLAAGYGGVLPGAMTAVLAGLGAALIWRRSSGGFP